jgi:hypothetical protein
MSKLSEYQLISGHFEKEEAKNLLTDLFASKIKYHSVSAWRYEEKMVGKVNTMKIKFTS